MEKIICLTDYKNHFGSKWKDNPHRSGFDKDYLARLFQKAGYKVEFLIMSQVDFLNPQWKGQIVLYTSSEEYGLHYKNFIEDVVYGLKESGARTIPSFKYLRANNNKVFMEILRDQMNSKLTKNIISQHFGCLEDLNSNADKLNPVSVIKSATGAMSRSVELSRDRKDIIRKAKKLSRTINIAYEIKDFLRKFKHKGYNPESKYRDKFITQNFIPQLTSDWKILIFWNRYYILKRPNRKNDFRASGSGKNYLYGTDAKIPDGIFDFAEEIFNELNVPILNIDIAYDGKNFYMLEFQVIYFGTLVHEKSQNYFMHKSGKWQIVSEVLDLEKIYVDCIVNYIENIKI